jgi:transposase-like protein
VSVRPHTRPYRFVLARKDGRGIQPITVDIAFQDWFIEVVRFYNGNYRIRERGKVLDKSIGVSIAVSNLTFGCRYELVGSIYGFVV